MTSIGVLGARELNHAEIAARCNANTNALDHAEAGALATDVIVRARLRQVMTARLHGGRPERERDASRLFSCRAGRAWLVMAGRSTWMASSSAQP